MSSLLSHHFCSFALRIILYLCKAEIIIGQLDIQRVAVQLVWAVCVGERERVKAPADQIHHQLQWV